jgi:hypothetical protein
MLAALVLMLAPRSRSVLLLTCQVPPVKVPLL